MRLEVNGQDCTPSPIACGINATGAVVCWIAARRSCLLRFGEHEQLNGGGVRRLDDAPDSVLYDRMVQHRIDTPVESESTCGSCREGQQSLRLLDVQQSLQRGAQAVSMNQQRPDAAQAIYYACAVNASGGVECWDGADYYSHFGGGHAYQRRPGGYTDWVDQPTRTWTEWFPVPAGLEAGVRDLSCGVRSRLHAAP